MVIPSFTAGQPQDGQKLGNSKVPIRDNLDGLAQTIAVDHIALNNSGQGKHSKIRFPSAQVVSPGTAAGEIAFYTKTVSGAPQLFFQPQGIAAAGTDIQMTNTVFADVTGANGVNSFTRYSFLPNNMVVVAGFATNAQDGSSITLSTQITVLVSINLSPLGNSPFGTDRAMVSQPRSIVAGNPASMVINLRDTNNNAIVTNQIVYFYVLGII